MNFCLCNCGEEVKLGKKFVLGHQRKGQKLSEEHKAKIFAANIGKIFSEETKVKMSFAHIGKTHSEESKVMMSVAQSGENNSMFGKHHSEETKAKMSFINSGEKCHLWQGGINNIPYGSGNTEELKEKIRIRDNHTCQECGKIWIGGEERFAPHHIDYNKNNHVPWNRITLCRLCHSKTNVNRKYWTKHFYEINFKNCFQRILGSWGKTV